MLNSVWNPPLASSQSRKTRNHAAELLRLHCIERYAGYTQRCRGTPSAEHDSGKKSVGRIEMFDLLKQPINICVHVILALPPIQEEVDSRERNLFLVWNGTSSTNLTLNVDSHSSVESAGISFTCMSNEERGLR